MKYYVSRYLNNKMHNQKPVTYIIGRVLLCYEKQKPLEVFVRQENNCFFFFIKCVNYDWPKVN